MQGDSKGKRVMDRCIGCTENLGIYRKGEERIFRGRLIGNPIKRIFLKEYPKEAIEALGMAGFKKEMLDYVLYR